MANSYNENVNVNTDKLLAFSENRCFSVSCCDAIERMLRGTEACDQKNVNVCEMPQARGSCVCDQDRERKEKCRRLLHEVREGDGLSGRQCSW